MQKILTALFFLVCPLLVLAQQKSFILIESSERIHGDVKANISYIRKPVFRQDNATLSCDSAVLYRDRNYFEAFKNVHINQADTVNIFSDHLTYDGNSKMAHLSGNVRMVDPHSVLTTNVLDYNMASKIGTYTNGGKIVTKDVTLTSKNGYYFANSHDSYFRYNVVVVTPQSTITSDTLRYNTDSKWTYFYGPTNIKGKDDNLYTENGAYNTSSELASFGKKNLYTQGSKSLKGDSLYYDGKAGYGKAVRNIVFTDTVEKTLMRGHLAYYYKQDERTIVTQNAYLGIATSDSVKVNNKMVPDSLWLGADTLETRVVLKKSLKLIPKPVIKKDNELDEESQGAENPAAEPGQGQKKNEAGKRPVNNKIAAKDKEEASPAKNKTPDKKVPKQADTIPNPVKPVLKDTLAKKPDLLKKDSTENKNMARKGIPVKDNTLKAETEKKDLQAKKAPSVKDTIASSPDDTVKTRIIKAYHKVKVFKNNMQAKTDSLFYTNADSTLRCFINPILWSEGSQQTGDTIYLQLKNKKLSNVQVIHSAFLVNTPKDSLKFNQIKGKYITGFFTDGKLKTLFVDGNAESIYFTRDDSTQVYKEMNQTVSSRIKVLFKNNEIDEILTIKSVEGAAYPIDKAPKEPILKGFIWKPKDRPKTKEDAIGSSGNKASLKPKIPASTKPAVKTGTPQPPPKKTVKN